MITGCICALSQVVHFGLCDLVKSIMLIPREMSHVPVGCDNNGSF